MRKAFALSCLVLLGCPKSESPPADDRLLKKLQEEKDRLEQGGQAARPIVAPITEPNPLAARAAMPDAPRTLAITGAPDFSCGKGACRVSSVETSHSVGGEKMSLTSDDYFFRVVLSVQLPGGGPLDLSGARLISGTEEFPIARDAQRLAGTRDLARVLKPDEKAEVILFFEAPGAAIAPGLKLVVVGGDGVSLQ